MIRKGDIVAVKSEFCEGGENRYIYIAIENEHDGSVEIQTINFEYAFQPIERVETYMLRARNINISDVGSAGPGDGVNVKSV
ncbi:MAG: hypothetical protein DRI46_12680 [Chloroflexi bacterium]|nr:MAG: hypothetical protein DRI46_12680 [Chloroflexota bacterium]